MNFYLNFSGQYVFFKIILFIIFQDYWFATFVGEHSLFGGHESEDIQTIFMLTAEDIWTIFMLTADEW